MYSMHTFLYCIVQYTDEENKVNIVFLFNWFFRPKVPLNYCHAYYQCQAGLGIHSFAHHSFDHFLKIDSIHSDCSGQMSDCEWITQVAHDTKAIEWIALFLSEYVFLLIPSFLVSVVSESLRSLTKNEWQWSNCSGRSPKMSEWGNHSFANFFQKTSDSFRKPMSEFQTLTFVLFEGSGFSLIQVSNLGPLAKSEE